MQKSVIEYLVNSAAKHPQKNAVQDSTGSITFSELLRSAFVIADAIKARGLWRSPIGVYIPKGCHMVQAFAGINMSGNFYVPLDTKSPDTRIQSILEVLESEAIITDKAHEQQVRQMCDKVVFVIEDVLENEPLTGADAKEYLADQIDTDPVYAIFTSGSTGTPKGVVISHRGVIDYIDWAIGRFGFTSDAVIGNQAPFYFDNSTLDIYLMYATGATLDIIPEVHFTFPAQLVDYMNEHKISFVFWVPYALINVANYDVLKDQEMPYLKDIFFAGEVMPNKHLNYWRRYLPHCRYANLYGPTEITVDCTYYEVDREFADDEPLPIGKACRNSGVLILTDQKREAGVNEEGELCVRGSSLALGYYNDWEKTQQAFIQNPLNKHYPETIYCTGDIVYKNERGEIMYVGRKDSQIKHNGYRIELGEIENAILASKLVDNCCATYDFNNKKIVLFYQAEKEVSKGEFRKGVANRIPRYMIPTDYYREDALKQNGSGKIDRSYYKKQING
ncbi:MAG: amino acid adenylation domain-containing protein [Prevotella sp.]|nr:amino acid adenylation domain-containing protein [Prevotella sp.]